MKKLMEAIKICYRHSWGEVHHDALQLVYDICREEGVNLAGCDSSNEMVKKIFSFLKEQRKNKVSSGQGINSDEKILDINYYRRKRSQVVLDNLMDTTNIDLVLYNVLARELLKFRYDRLKIAPITQLINDDEACSEEVIFIGIIGSLCKQYFAYGINEAINKYPQGDMLKERLVSELKGGNV